MDFAHVVRFVAQTTTEPVSFDRNLVRGLTYRIVEAPASGFDTADQVPSELQLNLEQVFGRIQEALQRQQENVLVSGDVCGEAPARLVKCMCRSPRLANHAVLIPEHSSCRLAVTNGLEKGSHVRAEISARIHLDGIEPGDKTHRIRQCLFGRHRCTFNQNGQHLQTVGECSLDLPAYVIGSGEFAFTYPVGTDQCQEDIGPLNRVLNGLGKISPRPDLRYVLKNSVLSEMGAQVLRD